MYSDSLLFHSYFVIVEIQGSQHLTGKRNYLCNSMYPALKVGYENIPKRCLKSPQFWRTLLACGRQSVV